jgi:hypothetical protein
LVAYTISDYVIERLKPQGVDTLFGVPSVYCASLYYAAENATSFSAIVTSSDLNPATPPTGMPGCAAYRWSRFHTVPVRAFQTNAGIKKRPAPI